MTRNINDNVAINVVTGVSKAPIEGKRNILITSALPYVNNVPHLGNIIGCLLSADVFARYCRARGYNAIFICGTDEYGTATETKAIEEGISCQALCDRYFTLHEDIYKWFQIDMDHFGRSATPKQTEITQGIFKKLNDRGYFSESSMEQLYCESCQRFLADRFVEGTCPLCGFHDARGDQCDGCGKLLNATELLSPRCKLDNATPVIRHSNHLFFDLERLQPACEAFVKASSEAGKWSANGIDITQSWFSRGLKSRCITRDLKWGTPVPHESMKDKVFYVWFDACIGYISITANFTEEWEKWWKSPEQVRLYQFMGKDNVPFHTVVFPCSLIGTEDPWTLLHHISTTEYLNYEDGKFSKSRGVGVFGNQAAETGIPPSVWRYYLLVNRPEVSDAVFSWDDLLKKNNGDLVGNLGNFVSRVVKFTQKYYSCVVPALPALSAADQAYVASVQTELTAYVEALEVVKIKAALRTAMAISNLGNGFLSSNSLSANLLSESPERCHATIHLALNTIYLLSALLYPFMPGTTQDILSQLNAPLRSIPDTFATSDLGAGHTISSASLHLFKKLEAKEIEELRARFAGKQTPGSADAASPIASPLAAEAKLSEKKPKQQQQQQHQQQQKASQPVVALNGQVLHDDKVTSVTEALAETKLDSTK